MPANTAAAANLLQACYSPHLLKRGPFAMTLMPNSSKDRFLPEWRCSKAKTAADYTKLSTKSVHKLRFAGESAEVTGCALQVMR